MSNQQIEIFITQDGQAQLRVELDKDTVWLSIDQMVVVFGRDKSVISRHVSNLFAQGELERKTVVAKFATTVSNSKTYQVDFPVTFAMC